jgi:Domain of unknown function (DUF4352)
VSTPVQPGQPTPAPTKRPWYRRPVPLVILAIAAILVISGIVGGGQDKNTTQPATQPAVSAPPASLAPTSAAPAAPKAAPKATIGTPVRDGKFEFTVTGMKPGVPSVGGQYLSKTAQGQYVLVTVKVANISDKPQTVFDSNQRLYDGNGRRFDADTAAAIYANDTSSSVFVTPINPGNSIVGTLVFDVPKDVTPTTIELHDSALSGGAKVGLS